MARSLRRHAGPRGLNFLADTSRIHGGCPAAPRSQSGYQTPQRRRQRITCEGDAWPRSKRSHDPFFLEEPATMSVFRRLFASASPSPQLMIALHCSASSSRQWDAYSKLLPREMRLVAPELMGYCAGEKWDASAPVSLEAEARRLG